MKLIIQPDAGLQPIIKAIQLAKKSIDVCVFRFDRDQIEKALASAAQRGATVRALIAFTNAGGENRLRKLEQRLLADGVTVARTSDDLLRYHAKYMIVDSVLYVFGFNFTKADTERSRSFAISTRDHAAVKEASKLFEADLTRQPYEPSKSHLVASPDTARTMLSAFLKGAKSSLAIYDTKVDDPDMLKLLKERVEKGVKVRLIGTIKKGSDIGVVNRKLPRRLHVRAIVRDGTRAFVGSQSLRKNELDNRREVGLIVNNPAVARKLLQVFEEDWESAVIKDPKLEKKVAKAEKRAKQKAA